MSTNQCARQLEEFGRFLPRWGVVEITSKGFEQFQAVALFWAKAWNCLDNFRAHAKLHETASEHVKQLLAELRLPRAALRINWWTFDSARSPAGSASKP
eukprot:11453478-Alexandrium_andersonii.AAC.1